MKIITAVFDYPGENEYSRCLAALEQSVKDTNPEAEFIAIRLDPPSECYKWNKPGWHNNHIKLMAYAEELITEPTFFVDADTIIQRDLSDLVGDFDIAIAERPAGANAPFNLGVVLVMPTVRSEFFMDAWARTDTKMLEDYDFHMEWRRKYSGQNQSSFGYLYETIEPGKIDIKKYPTNIMNACEQDWTKSEISYIIHIKTRLREAALSDKPLSKIKPGLRKPVETWRKYEQKAIDSIGLV